MVLSSGTCCKSTKGAGFHHRSPPRFQDATKQFRLTLGSEHGAASRLDWPLRMFRPLRASTPSRSHRTPFGRACGVGERPVAVVVEIAGSPHYTAVGRYSKLVSRSFFLTSRVPGLCQVVVNVRRHSQEPEMQGDAAPASAAKGSESVAG